MSGRALREPALVNHAPAGHGPSGFDPAREENDIVAVLLGRERFNRKRGAIKDADIQRTAAATIDRLRRELSRATGRQRVGLIDQDGKEVGHRFASMRELLTEEVFVDDGGTVWLPSTAWAYFAACKALRRTRDSAGSRMAETNEDSARGEAEPARAAEGGIAQDPSLNQDSSNG